MSDIQYVNVLLGTFLLAPCSEVYVYDRDHLLSLRFLKECLEPPKDLFFPGAIDLVRRTEGDVAGPKRGRRYP